MANALRWLEVASHDDVTVTWLEPSISFFAVVVFFVFGFSLFCFLCRDLLSRDSIKTKTKRFAGGGRHFFFVTVHFCLIFVGFWWSMDLLAARYVTFFLGGGFFLWDILLLAVVVPCYFYDALFVLFLLFVFFSPICSTLCIFVLVFPFSFFVVWWWWWWWGDASFMIRNRIRDFFSVFLWYSL